ncbi:MAG: hypothetical protein Q8P26_00150 [Candidatus Levybacteria bacterium]|nr:hypothetical protein [Candidatus Levybacteria bacterium]
MNFKEIDPGKNLARPTNFLERVNRRINEKFEPILMINLRLAYEQFSRSSEFPKGYCYPTALLLAKKLGLGIEQGYFMVDDDRMPDRRHAWNINKKGDIIDLTLAQFNPLLRQPIKSGVLIVKSRDSLYGRYVSEDGVFFRKSALSEILNSWK